MDGLWLYGEDAAILLASRNHHEDVDTEPTNPLMRAPNVRPSVKEPLRMPELAPIRHIPRFQAPPEGHSNETTL